MIRIVSAAAAAVLLVAAAPTQDWRATTGTAPSGAFTVGSPAAKTVLVEYLSFTCGHCGHFVAESKAALHDTLVRQGKVRVETRSAARDPYDLAAWLVARCGGPARFHALTSSIFAQQADWVGKGEAYATANLPTLKAMPQLKQLETIAEKSGLTAIAARNGVTPARTKACFATDADLKRVLGMTQAAFAKINGTPSFEVNGTLEAEAHDWASIEPKVRASLVAR